MLQEFSPLPLSVNVGKCLMLVGLISCTMSWQRTNTNLGSVLTLGIQVALCNHVMFTKLLKAGDLCLDIECSESRVAWVSPE